MAPKPDNPLAPVGRDIQRTNLSALVRRRIHNDREYPAVIQQVLDNRIYAKLMPPVLRSMRQDHREMEIDQSLTVSGSGLQKGDRVLLQREDDHWLVTTTLTSDIYAQKLHKAISEHLLTEGMRATPALVRRAARRRFEKWFKMEGNEGTPWAVPGRLKEGQTLLSRKIVHWCAQQGGAELDQALRQGLPRTENWGNGPLVFGLFPLDEDSPQFSAVALPDEEHQSLIDSWRELLSSKPKTAKSHSLPAPREETAAIAKPKSSGRVPVPLPEPAFIEEEEEAGLLAERTSIFHPFPHQLAALIEGLRLPMPPQPLTEGMSTLVAWSQSDHPGLRERVTDFMMMLLADGEEVRPNPLMRDLWTEWHRCPDPVQKLCLLVEPGEEPAAIRAIVGRPAPGPAVAAALSDHLLLRWRRFLLKSHPPIEEEEAPRKAPPPPTMVDFRVALRRRGIRCADIWMDRLLLTLLSAQHLGHVVVLSSPRRIAAPLITDALCDSIENSRSEVIRLPRRRTHLLGKINREQDIFQFSPLTQALRRASRLEYLSSRRSPYLVLIEDLGQHAKTDALPAVLKQAGEDKGALLFSEEENQRWLKEYEEFHTRDDLDSHEELRRDLLEDFYAADSLGGQPPERAWRLRSPENLVLMGVLDTDRAAKALDILSHAFVLTVPELDTDDIETALEGRQEGLPRVVLAKQELKLEGTWERFPHTREQLFEIMRCLGNCNFSLTPALSQQVATFLAYAEAWGIHDGPVLVSHLTQTLVLPRIRCLGNDAIPAMRKILELDGLSPDLQKTVSHLINRAIQHRHELFHGAIR